MEFNTLCLSQKGVGTHKRAAASDLQRTYRQRGRPVLFIEALVLCGVATTLVDRCSGIRNGKSLVLGSLSIGKQQPALADSLRSEARWCSVQGRSTRATSVPGTARGSLRLR